MRCDHDDQGMRLKPVSGARYFAGTVIRQDGHMGRHVAVLFKCAHCKNGIGRARFSCLKAGEDKKHQTKSCKCRKEARFWSYHTKAAALLSLAQARQIFNSYCLVGSKKTSEAFAISVYLSHFVRLRWRRLLEALPEVHRREVYELCQISWRAARQRFDRSASELHWICQHWRKGLQARAAELLAYQTIRAESRAHALAIFAQYAPIGSFTGSVYDDASFYMDSAIADAADPSRYFGLETGELSSLELSLKKRSDYEWVHRMVLAMHPQQVSECFGPIGEKFQATCAWTLECRRQRLAHILNRKRLGLPMTKRVRNLHLKAEPYRYLPKPSAHPATIAQVIVDWLPAARAA
jgi:hypothetical protein